MDFEPVPVALEPTPDISVFVVRGVVLDKEDSTPPEAFDHVLDEAEVRLGVENTVSLVHELGSVQLDGAQDLDALALSSHRDEWLATDARPGRMECRVLPEARLVCEDESSAFSLGFFLMFG